MISTAASEKCPADRKMKDKDALSVIKKSPRSTSLAEVTRGDDKRRGGEAFGMKGWNVLASNSLEPLLNALQMGPVGVSVAGSGWSAYGSGIFDSCEKDATIDHAVVAVGYGTEGQKKYWKIRNSWGDLWGENGYIRLLRHDSSDAYCGTDRNPAVGTACVDEQGQYPKTQPVCGMCGVLFDSVLVTFKKGNKGVDAKPPSFLARTWM